MEFIITTIKDKFKYLWDNNILNAVNGNFYAFSWYLDIVSPNWIGIMSSDFKILAPVPYKNILGIKTVYQPFFTQQLGIFTTDINLLSNSQKIIDIIYNNFSRCYLQLNKYNSLNPSDYYKVTKRVNYELDLISNYSTIQEKYSENTQRNLIKAKKNRLTFTFNEIRISSLISFIRDNLMVRLPEIKKKDYETFKKIVYTCEKKNMGDRVAVYDDDGELLAVAYFVFSHDKLYYLFGSSTEEGKQKGAMFFLFDSYIKIYSKSEFILDFEGSSIPGIARFFKGFGAKETYYPVIQYKRLPFIRKNKK